MSNPNSKLYVVEINNRVSEWDTDSWEAILATENENDAYEKWCRISDNGVYQVRLLSPERLY